MVHYGCMLNDLMEYLSHDVCSVNQRGVQYPATLDNTPFIEVVLETHMQSVYTYTT